MGLGLGKGFAGEGGFVTLRVGGAKAIILVVAPHCRVEQVFAISRVCSIVRSGE